MVTNPLVLNKLGLTLNYNLSINSDESKSESQIAFGIKVYPNPASDFMEVEMNNNDESDYSIFIYDILGREVYSKFNLSHRNSNSRQIVSLKELPAGRYFLTTIIKDKSYSKKIIIIK